MFNGRRYENLIMKVTWADPTATFESALERSAAWAQARVDKAAERQLANVGARMSQTVPSERCKNPVAEIPLDFPFEGKIQARSDGRRGKLTRGYIELTKKQSQVLQQHPQWRQGFKLDVFWHRNDCEHRATL